MLKILQIILAVIVLVILVYYYNEFKKDDYKRKYDKYDLIQQFLLGNREISLDKPFLWIHNDHQINSRKWETFSDRNNFSLNQPYLHLCIKSIIKHCQDSFNVCLIDDNTFKRLIPDWNITMNRLANPIKKHMRILGFTKLLYNYGGMLIPSSTVCLRDLYPMFKSGISKHGFFAIEGINRTNTSVLKRFLPSYRTMGCIKHNTKMKEFIEFLTDLVYTDYTNEIDFTGEVNKWLFQKSLVKHITLLDGKTIGLKTIDDKEVFLNDLISSHYIEYDKRKLYAIVFQGDEILKRTNLQWFSVLSKDKVLSADTMISNHLLISLN
ncbi:hypothetical protein OAI84_00090 [bacterium]|nr:hypothetical protein [bacterium]